MKRNALIGLIALIGIMILSTVGLSAAPANLIGETKAYAIAFADAGADAGNVTAKTIELDVDDGIYVYELEFIFNDREYEYTIAATSGKILEKDVEAISSGRVTPPATTEITAAEAKAIALKHAGLSENQVQFAKIHKETDDGIVLYDLEFAVITKTTYDYEIAAVGGKILKASSEPWEFEDYADYKNMFLAAFHDVPINAYYTTAVQWATDKAITNGTGSAVFSPNTPCDRAQVLTFLWRNAGTPEPTVTDTPFNDVVAGSYYEKAVAWALENGITEGTTNVTFSPNAPCTRGQVVALLHRSKGQPETTFRASFGDINASDYFSKAVDWAAANKITTGTSASTFSPNNTCTRAHIVTFLYNSEK